MNAISKIIDKNARPGYGFFPDSLTNTYEDSEGVSSTTLSLHASDFNEGIYEDDDTGFGIRVKESGNEFEIAGVYASTEAAIDAQCAESDSFKGFFLSNEDDTYSVPTLYATRAEAEVALEQAVKEGKASECTEVLRYSEIEDLGTE